MYERIGRVILKRVDSSEAIGVSPKRSHNPLRFPVSLVGESRSGRVVTRGWCCRNAVAVARIESCMNQGMRVSTVAYLGDFFYTEREISLLSLLVQH